MPNPSRIEREAQLLVEGNDARNFFEALRDHLSLPSLQIQNFGGVDELRPFLSLFIKASNFQTVGSLGIVRDAEDDAAGAFRSVQGALQAAGLRIPDAPGNRVGRRPAVTVMILPGRDRAGMLETLLCETVAEDVVRPCIEDFFACVDERRGGDGGPSPKARARAFLATTAAPHLSVGVAAKRGLWNLNHDALEAVRAFLRDVAVQRSRSSTDASSE